MLLRRDLHRAGSQESSRAVLRFKQPEASALKLPWIACFSECEVLLKGVAGIHLQIVKVCLLSQDWGKWSCMQVPIARSQSTCTTSAALGGQPHWAFTN